MTAGAERVVRLDKLLERLPRIAEALAGFDPEIRGIVFDGLIGVLNPGLPPDPASVVYVGGNVDGSQDRADVVPREVYDEACRQVAMAHTRCGAEDRAGDLSLLVQAWNVIESVGVHKGGWEVQHPDWVADATRFQALCAARLREAGAELGAAPKVGH